MTMRTRRRGFTLVELLIVMLILGVLATIGVSRLWQAKDRAFQATVRQDLKILATQQEVYFERNLTYAGAASDLADYQSSNGVVVTISWAQPNGWAATATHNSLPGFQCGYYSGDAPAANASPATQPGLVGCTN